MLRWVKGLALTILVLVVLLLTAAGVSYVAAEAPLVLPTVSNDKSLPSLEIRGVKLHLQTEGDPKNDTIILLHGGPGNDYRHLLSLLPLGDEYHLVFYDQRGAGLSERVRSEER